MNDKQTPVDAKNSSTNEYLHHKNSTFTLQDAIDEAAEAEQRQRRWSALRPEQTTYPIYKPVKLQRWVTGCYHSLEEYVIQNRTNFDNYDEAGDNYIPTLDEYRRGMRMTPARLATIPSCGYNEPYPDGR